MVSHMCVCWCASKDILRREMAETHRFDDHVSFFNLKRRNFAIWFLTCVYTMVWNFKWYFRSISFVVYFSRRSAFCVVIFNRWSSSVFMTYIVIVVFTKPAIYWSWTNLPLLINCWPSQTTVTLLIHYWQRVLLNWYWSCWFAHLNISALIPKY